MRGLVAFFLMPIWIPIAMLVSVFSSEPEETYVAISDWAFEGKVSKRKSLNVQP